jgi:lysophospholipase L1-like esterase
MKSMKSRGRHAIIAMMMSPVGCASDGGKTNDPEQPSACSDGYVECAEECVDLLTNPGHCGVCDVVCGSGQTCSNGMCNAVTSTGGTGGTLIGTGGAETGSGGVGDGAGGMTSGGAGGTTGDSGGAGGIAVGSGGAGVTTGGSGGMNEVPPCETNEVSACAEANGEIACHFGGDPGDYRVTVELGGEEAGEMVVEAEMYRRMFGETSTPAGETRRFAFTTNVRVYEGQPVDPDQKGSSTGVPGLDVYIRGAAPQLASICWERADPQPKVWVAGDSTVCDQAGTNYSGWGQHLPQFFDESVSVSNYADSGESSGSFLNGAKLWSTITSGWTAGDWVFIQFGHNDKDVTADQFRSNLRAMVGQAEAAGVHAILVTPIARVGTELAGQHVNSTQANLSQIIRDLGLEENVPVIDLTVTTWTWLQTIDWTEYFALGTDRTHPNPQGAEIIAGFVVDAIQSQNIELSEHLR